MKRLAAVAALLCVATQFTPALAQSAGGDGTSAPAFQDFTFKRVTPPKPGQKKRITVQITPNAIATLAQPSAGSGNSAPAAGGLPYPWFWNEVGIGLDQASAGRLAKALRSLQTSSNVVPAPRLQTLQNIASQHGTVLLTETVGKPVSPALALAVIAVESAGRVDAVSTAGAQGLMQLMPATAQAYGVVDAFDPKQNIKGGVALLSDLMAKYKGDPVLVLAAYNAGSGSIRDNGGVPPYAETRAYVPKVLSAWQIARGLCVTPPELLTDGCVFAVRKN